VDGALFALKCVLTPKPLLLLAKKLQHNYIQKKRAFKKKFKLYNNGVKSRLAFQEKESFLHVYDLPRLHKVQSKEHMKKRKHFPLCF
jgi:hypothetical protein